jgi:DDE family transposase
MLDVDTFLTTLYVMVDDFCQSYRPQQRRPGPQASLCESEVITLAIFARWSRFSSERDFYRYAEGHLREAFPTLPDRSQFNRLVRSCTETIEKMALHLARIMQDSQPPYQAPYQALDASAMPVRDAKRRGYGWLAGRADIGWSNSLGWYEGFSLLTAVEPSGMITGFCFGAASTADQPLAETFFKLRANPDSRLISVGSAFSGTYVADKGFEGVENRRRWLESYGADLIHPPKRNSKKPWSKGLRRWVAGLRQIVETVYDKLFNIFGLWRERPHEIEGLRARLAARVTLHNFCIWLNDRLGRPRLAFADLLGW